MDFLPIFITLDQRSCLIVGGGEVALRKAQLLLQAQGKVTLVAPEIVPEIYNLKGSLKIHQRIFHENDLEDVDLVIVATDNHILNVDISQRAKDRGVLINVVDNPKLCNFIVPSIVDRSPMIIAIGSSGTAPVLARLVRSKIESMIPHALGNLGKLAQKYRQTVKDTFASLTQRRRFWESIFEGEVADTIYLGKNKLAEEKLLNLLKQGAANLSKEGEVALVGGGPGDPELMTLKAVRLLQRADVVVYDRLISQPIIDLARRDAQRIYVGKESDNHTLPQDQINQLLVDLAQKGQRVVRLKGGDPFIFGRGGEEIATLMDNQVKFQVVPGITSASGCSSYCGIPLTHRDYAHSVVFATGHLKDNTVDLNWKGLAQPWQTIVIYMGMKGLEIICAKLIEHGLPATTPVAVIHKGTSPDQKIVIGDLITIQTKVQQQQLKPPSLIIIGEVVKLHEQLSWFGESEALASFAVNQ